MNEMEEEKKGNRFIKGEIETCQLGSTSVVARSGK
jgi:hypothetical protein